MRMNSGLSLCDKGRDCFVFRVASNLPFDPDMVDEGCICLDDSVHCTASTQRQLRSLMQRRHMRNVISLSSWLVILEGPDISILRHGSEEKVVRYSVHVTLSHVGHALCEIGSQPYSAVPRYLRRAE